MVAQRRLVHSLGRQFVDLRWSPLVLCGCCLDSHDPAAHLLSQKATRHNVSEHFEDHLVIDKKFSPLRRLAIQSDHAARVQLQRTTIATACSWSRWIAHRRAYLGHPSDRKGQPRLLSLCFCATAGYSTRLIIIAGDIIDYDRFLPWIEPLFKDFTAHSDAALYWES